MNQQNNKYSYREGTTGDITQLQVLGLLSYGQYKNVLSEDSWAKMAATTGSTETYFKLLEIARCFVCEFENKIIGMAFLIPKGNPFAFFQEDWSYIRLVGVDPKYEGQGIGRKLTEMCLDFAKKSGEKVIALHTSEFQNAARHIYETMGFKKIKALDPIFNKKYWLYCLDLNQGPESITYHRADESDLQTLIGMRLEFSFELSGPQSPEAIKSLSFKLKDYFTEALLNKTCIFYLAKNNDTTVGIGGMIIRDCPGNFKNPSGRWGYMMNMYTIPSFRRKGICGKLLNLLVEAGNKEAITSFELHATVEGEYVYKLHGFEMHNEPTYRKYLK